MTQYSLEQAKEQAELVNQIVDILDDAEGGHLDLQSIMGNAVTLLSSPTRKLKQRNSSCH